MKYLNKSFSVAMPGKNWPWPAKRCGKCGGEVYDKRCVKCGKNLEGGK